MDSLRSTAATINLVQTIISSYNAIQSINSLPRAFKEVGEGLPLLRETLDLVRSKLQASPLDNPTQNEIEPIIKGCQEKTNTMNEIFQEIEKKHKESNEWSTLVSAYRAMMIRMGKANRVEILMKGVLNSLKGLVVHPLFTVATRAQVSRLKSAIERLSEVEASLPDSDFETNGTNFIQNIDTKGKGNMFNAIGGPMTNKFGNDYNTTGPMHFGTDFMKIMKNQN